jgi:hypothetical protein
MRPGLFDDRQRDLPFKEFGGIAMKEKIGFYSSLLFSLLLCVLLYSAVLMLAGRIHQVPSTHKQVLLIGFLLWFVSLVLGRDRNDDWAGQF